MPMTIVANNFFIPNSLPFCLTYLLKEYTQSKHKEKSHSVFLPENKANNPNSTSDSSFLKRHPLY